MRVGDNWFRKEWTPYSKKKNRNLSSLQGTVTTKSPIPHGKNKKKQNWIAGKRIRKRGGFGGAKGGK